MLRKGFFPRFTQTTLKYNANRSFKNVSLFKMIIAGVSQCYVVPFNAESAETLFDANVVVRDDAVRYINPNFGPYLYIVALWRW